MYKLYAQNKQAGWKLLKTDEDLDKLTLLGQRLKPKEYFEYMIIEHTEKGDATIRRQELYDEEYYR